MSITPINATEKNTGAASLSHTIDKPTGVITGDLVVWFVLSQFAPTATPTGFTVIRSTTAGGVALNSYRRQLDGSEGATFSVTLTSSGIATLAMVAIRGYNRSTPIDTHAETTSASPGDGSVPGPSVTPTASGVLLGFYTPTNATSVSGISVPAGMAVLDTGTNSYAYAMAYQLVGAAATGIKTATFTGGSYASAAEAAQHVVVKGAAGGGWGVVHI